MSPSTLSSSKQSVGTDITPIHSELGASQASRWIPCPGSVALIATLPPGIDGGGSWYAQEGTAAHELARKCLMDKPGELLDPASFVGTEIEGFDVDFEMVEAVRVYLDYCWSIVNEGPVMYWVEKRFSLEQLNPPAPMYGTADFSGYNEDTCILKVVDLKYGKGVRVEVQGNPQTRYYGIGSILSIQKQLGRAEIKGVELTIVQPRAYHPDGFIRTEVMDYQDLLFYSRDLLDHAHKTMNPNAPRVAGDHCRWCNAAAICPEKKELATEVARSEFAVVEAINPPLPESLSIEEVSYILTQLPALEEWIGQLRSYAYDMLKTGENVPGFKLVAKRANRKWKDETTVKEWADMIGINLDDLYEKKFLSPNKTEIKFGKKNVPEELWHQPSTGSTLAAEVDTRPGINAADEFKGLPLPE